jgi:predicted regulator of Ras-like GTPase activity (Roadblock/LC7/MglB family)
MAAGLSVEQGRVLNAAIADLVVQAEAAAAFLTDYSGNVLAQRSSRDTRSVQTIAALSAGAFCATRELAGVIGEKTFHSISHQGEKISIYMQSIAGQFLLLVLFDHNTTEGLVKLYVKRLCEELEPLLREVAGQTVGSAAPRGQRFEMDSSGPVFPRTSR